MATGQARRAVSAWLSILPLLWVSLGARADEAVRIGEVEVVGGRQAPPPKPTVKEDPTGFGTVIETGEFAGEAQAAAELLLRAPGVRIHHGPGGATLMLRGNSADQSLVLLDGIPLNASAGGGVDLRTIPAGLLERITVLRGNEGARYGAGALGGVALLQTRSLREGVESTLSLTAGSFGTAELEGSFAGGGERARGLVAFDLRRSDGDYPALYDPTPNFDPDDAFREPMPNNDDRGAALLLKGALSLDDGTEVHALANGYLAERGIPGTLYQRDLHRRSERRILSALRIVHEASADLLVEGGLELRHDEVAVWAEEPRWELASPPPSDEAMPWQVENALTLRARTDWIATSWTRLMLQAEAGGEWLDSPYHGRGLRREKLAAALHDELYLGRSITVAPSLRFDRVGDHEGLSPKLGIAFRPIGPLELRASWGRTFRAPSFGELYLEQGRVKANPELEAEHGWTADGGAVIRLAPLLLQLSVFHSRIENLILYEQQPGFISKPFNFAEASITGGEAEVVARLASWMTASASYSLARTRNLRDDPLYWGKELPYRPAHRAHARLAGRLDDYEAFVEGAWQSAQWKNRANATSLPGSTVFRTGAGTRLIRSPFDLWLSGQVENLFDERVEDLLGFPQPGRAFFATLRVTPPGAAFQE